MDYSNGNAFGRLSNFCESSSTLLGVSPSSSLEVTSVRNCYSIFRNRTIPSARQKGRHVFCSSGSFCFESLKIDFRKEQFFPTKMFKWYSRTSLSYFRSRKDIEDRLRLLFCSSENFCFESLPQVTLLSNRR